MSLPRLIAICGNARHGKDTAGAYLAERYGYVRYSLAAPLKAAACELFGWSPEWIEEHKAEIDPRYGLSPRQALQALGTEYGQLDLARLFPEFSRVTGRSLWVKRLIERSAKEPRVVVTDCRFPHEEEAIHAAGGIVIRVWRPDVPVDLTHESERAVTKVHEDYFALNDGSLGDLYNELDEIMEGIA